MVVFVVDISRRMMELRRTSLQCGRRTLLSQQCNSISGMARLTSRQGHLGRLGSERYRDLSDGSGVRIEQFASLKHRMHNNRQLARHGHGGSFEADPLPELQTPRAQSAVGGAARQNDRRRFVEKSSQMGVATSDIWPS